MQVTCTHGFDIAHVAAYVSDWIQYEVHVADKDRSQGEAAYTALLSHIRSGAFGPGDRLREVDVAKRLSLSRTPVREALRRLETDGIVEHRPRVGAVIRTLGHGEMVELYEMRTVLERTTAGLAAKHATKAEIDALRDINTQIGQAGPDATASLNQDFHRGLYHATRNRFLLEAARSLNNALLLLRPTTLDDPDRLKVITKQHNDMLSAIAVGDAEAAAQAAEIHLQTSLRYRLKTRSRK